MWDTIKEIGIVVYVLVPMGMAVIGLFVFGGLVIADKLKKKTLGTAPRDESQ